MSQSPLADEPDDEPMTMGEMQSELNRLDTIATRAMNRAYEAEERVGELEARVDELDDLVDTLQSRVPDRGVDEKLADLVQYAVNKRDGEAIVPISREELQGVWGCSRRYSYDLCDEDEDGLPASKSWILGPTELYESQFGNAEIDHGANRSKKIAIDFTGAVARACPVNRFITERDGNGGEE